MAAGAASATTTQKSDVDSVVDAVSSRRDAWRQRSAGDKLSDLVALRDALELHGAQWAAASARVRGGKPDGSTPRLDAAGWLPSVVILGSVLNGLIRTYRGRASGGGWTPPPGQRTRADGQKVVTVYPNNLLDKLYAPGHRGELWLQPGADGKQASAYHDGAGLCAILGAGNYEAPIDILTKMFTENRVVVYKPNPVNEATSPVLERILAPLVEAGYLAFVRGGVDAGHHLIHHHAVDEVLMTGGAATHDRIVWGEPAEQEKNKRAGNKLLSKRFDTELGGAAPVIVVPGDWSEREIDHHAAQLAACKVLNGAHVCASPQVIVVDSAWPQRQAFLDQLRHHLSSTPPDPSFYPGAGERQARFKSAYPQAENLRPPEAAYEHQLDRILIPDAARESLATREEAFCPVLAEVAIDAGDARTFLDEAVAYCNNELFGSLSATVLVDPRTERELGGRLDDAIAGLEYGSIGVNTWGATAVFFGELSWGAFPKHTPEDIQSGIGVLNNTYMLDRPQKSVFWSPFVSPVHLQPARPRDLKVMPRMAHYRVRPTMGRLTKVMSAGLLGV